MRDFRRYRLVGAARRKAESYGLSEADVLLMARQSAPYRHPRFNRRFEDYLFLIQNDSVISFEMGVEVPDWARRCTYCKGRRVFVAYEKHESCDGQGCEDCDLEGEVRVERPCRAVTERRRVPCSDFDEKPPGIP